MFKTSVLSLLATSLVASVALADTFDGRISIKDGQKYFTPSTTPNVVWKLDGLSDEVKTQLGSLQDGDFLSATGELTKLDQTAYVETVDFVGLKRILGRWVSKDGTSIVFKDFRSAEVEQQQPLPWNPDDERKVDLVYTILPLKAADWSLLMSNRKTVRVGTLQIHDSDLTIQLVDQTTGKITEDISLSPSNQTP